jgi:fumarate reductase subunit D
MIASASKHRGSLLWIASLIHRLSGLALAIFLPIHFFVLGLSFHGGDHLDAFLRWSDQPLVKLAEGGLIFLLTIHLLGGLRVLVVENFPWWERHKQMATIAAALSALVAFAFLLRAL